MLIGIAGKKQHGKNTICNIIKENIKDTEVVIISFADPIRKIGEIFGFTQEEMLVNKNKLNDFWGVSWRSFAQLVGTDMFRKMFRDYCWVKLA